ncbi:MAG TPA: hypothetical protein DCF33_08325 [Saprospirales bacterium]|nr:hypothetical protein [Saprospirales bacterium]
MNTFRSSESSQKDFQLAGARPFKITKTGLGTTIELFLHIVGFFIWLVIKTTDIAASNPLIFTINNQAS